jgi:TonB family protein
MRFKFARSSVADQGAAAGSGGEYIGDRDVAAPRTRRAPTTAERSLGNARGTGVAMTVPDGHENAADAPVLDAVVAPPSPTPVEAVPDAPGAPAAVRASLPPVGPSGVRLTWAGEVSDAEVERVASIEVPAPVPVRKRPRRPVPPPSPAAAPAAPAAPAPPAPPKLDDDFWDGFGGTGETSTDVAVEGVDAQPGADVQRLRLKVDGAGWTELTALDEDVQQAARAEVGVRKTELGTWFAMVDDEVRAGWRPSRATTALGYSGRVVVTFQIERDGTIRAARVSSSNVVVELEQAALDAIPHQVPPPPRGFGPVEVEFTFRYTDVTSGAIPPLPR